jgi:hypothetical protein
MGEGGGEERGGEERGGEERGGEEMGGEAVLSKIHLQNHETRSESLGPDRI